MLEFATTLIRGEGHFPQFERGVPLHDFGGAFSLAKHARQVGNLRLQFGVFRHQRLDTPFECAGTHIIALKRLVGRAKFADCALEFADLRFELLYARDGFVLGDFFRANAVFEFCHLIDSHPRYTFELGDARIRLAFDLSELVRVLQLHFFQTRSHLAALFAQFIVPRVGRLQFVFQITHAFAQVARFFVALRSRRHGFCDKHLQLFFHFLYLELLRFEFLRERELNCHLLPELCFGGFQALKRFVDICFTRRLRRFYLFTDPSQALLIFPVLINTF
mmetsp:Transcript_5744/g.22658  ORF Transcript_5744/g.22658 Transcript_5744/m.22658 type:complete len:277 (+) Transcript_5744:2994-3824(+)